MSLQDKIPEIKAHMETQWNQLMHETRMHDIYTGQLQPYIDASLDREYSKEDTRARVKQRVPYINFTPRIVNKMSKVYNEGAIRKSTTPEDQELLDWYAWAINLDVKMTDANKMLNLNKRVALEPYLDRWSRPQLRVIPAHLFSVMSDDPNDPTKPTIFIKFVGQKIKRLEPTTDNYGVKTRQADSDYRNVSVFYVYTAEEFMIMDSDGGIRTDLMAELNLPYWSDGVNPLGRIPAVYIKSDQFNLIPPPDTDMFSMAIQVPKLLADLNYAVSYNSHSIVAIVDGDVADLKNTPDATWVINSTIAQDGTKQTARVEVLQPQVDIPNVLQLIQTTLGLWFESRNIRADQIGKVDSSTSISGVAKMIDEMDTSMMRNEQVQVFQWAEYELWDLIKQYHNLGWNRLIMQRSGEEYVVSTFSNDFAVDIRFPEVKPQLTELERLTLVERKIQLGALTRLDMIMELHGFDLQEAEQYLALLDEEKAEAVAEAQANMINQQPEEEAPQDGTQGSDQLPGEDNDESDSDSQGRSSPE